MTESTFDTLVRGTESRQGRRHALKAFGAAALAAAVGAPLAAEAKKNGKNRKKRKDKKGGGEQECPICPAEDCTLEAEAATAARCLAQVEECNEVARDVCGEGNAECVLSFRLCCEELGVCDVTGFFTCIVTSNQT